MQIFGNVISKLVVRFLLLAPVRLAVQKALEFKVDQAVKSGDVCKIAKIKRELTSL